MYLGSASLLRHFSIMSKNSGGLSKKGAASEKYDNEEILHTSTTSKLFVNRPLKRALPEDTFEKNKKIPFDEAGGCEIEFHCFKCGERFQDFIGVVYHDCPRKETKRRRLLHMFEILDYLQAKKSAEAEKTPNESIFFERA